jgi:PAS domain S-box-containing protein
MPQIVWIARPDGWNIYFNQRWVEYTGLSLEDSYGFSWIKPIHEKDKDRSQKMWEDAVAVTGIYSVECRIRRADGVYRWWLVRGVPLLDPLGNVVKWFGTCTDVHDMKLAEISINRSKEEIQSLNEELELRVARRTADLTEATQEAERANQSKSEFLSRMSHELRTPLNAILGFGQILDKKELDPLATESVGYILKGGRHLLGLINEVLDLARVEAGGIEISIEPIDVADVVREACSLVGPLAADREIRLRIVSDGETTPFVNADVQRLKQVLLNLLSNAIKYNRLGGQVEVTWLAPASGRVQIDVRDTGLGISPGNLAKLFTPFERLGFGSSEVEGTGLGLALSKGLMEAMGGRILVVSTQEVGSTFSLDLAAAKTPDQTRINPISLPRSEGSAEGARKYSVLAIEDNPSNIRLLEVILAGRPEITLLSAMQGSVALDLARQFSPDLIILDLNLPDMSGMQVLALLRNSDNTRSVPVIVVSADATPSQIERLLNAGATQYLTKPLDIDEFLKTVDANFRPKQTATLL